MNSSLFNHIIPKVTHSCLQGYHCHQEKYRSKMFYCLVFRTITYGHGKISVSKMKVPYRIKLCIMYFYKMVVYLSLEHTGLERWLYRRHYVHKPLFFC